MIAVIGGGVMGLAAAWRLAATGREVAVFERHAIGHDRGSSHGTNRIFRYAYDHPAYVHLARAALPMWRELEEQHEELLSIRGGIDTGDRAALERCEVAMGSAGAMTQWLEEPELRERFPWVEPPPGRVLYSPDTGVLAADAAVRRLTERARRAGVTLHEHTVVRALTIEGDAVWFLAGDEHVRAQRVVVAAGAWTRGVLQPLGIALPVRATQEQVFYVDGPGSTVPVIHRGDRFFYTVPAFDGSGLIKVGEHVAGPTIDPDAKAATVEPAAAGALTAWVAERLPAFGPIGERGETCLYTMTPDEHFVLDVRGPVVFVSACSGHGFKFAPLIGEIAACLATDREPPADLDLFALDRS